MEATGKYEADETWMAPRLFNVSKVTLLGKRPVNFTVAPGQQSESGRWRELEISVGDHVPVSAVDHATD